MTQIIWFENCFAFAINDNVCNRLVSTGGYVEFTTTILPFFGFEEIVILLSPSGNTRSSVDTKDAFSFFASLLAKSSDAFPPITVIADNKSTI